jgi:hypothetical protein
MISYDVLRVRIILNPMLNCLDEVFRGRLRLHKPLGRPLPRVLLRSKNGKMGELYQIRR